MWPKKATFCSHGGYCVTLQINMILQLTVLMTIMKIWVTEALHGYMLQFFSQKDKEVNKTFAIVVADGNLPALLSLVQCMFSWLKDNFVWKSIVRSVNDTKIASFFKQMWLFWIKWLVVTFLTNQSSPPSLPIQEHAHPNVPSGWVFISTLTQCTPGSGIHEHYVYPMFGYSLAP